MGLSSRKILDIIELAYYVPVLPISIWVVLRHGHGRQLGWIYLSILAVLRIIGGGTGVAAQDNLSSKTLIEVSTIAFSIGLSPLLLAFLGIIKRVTEGMKGQGVRPAYLRIISLLTIVGLVLATYGGVQEFSSDANTVSNGFEYAKVGVILFVVGYLAIVVVTGITWSRRAAVLDGERRLVLAGLFSIPFLAVRVVYSICSVFDHTSSAFDLSSSSNTVVIVQAAMSVTMEFVVVAIYLTAGVITRVIPRSLVKQGYLDPPSYNAPVGQPPMSAPHQTQTGNYAA